MKRGSRLEPMNFYISRMIRSGLKHLRTASFMRLLNTLAFFCRYSRSKLTDPNLNSSYSDTPYTNESARISYELSLFNLLPPFIALPYSSYSSSSEFSLLANFFLFWLLASPSESKNSSSLSSSISKILSRSSSLAAEASWITSFYSSGVCLFGEG